jgi:hypothetical protein
MTDRAKTGRYGGPVAVRERLEGFLDRMSFVGNDAESHVVRAGSVRGTDGQYWNFEHTRGWPPGSLERICGGLLVVRVMGTPEQRTVDASVHVPSGWDMQCTPLAAYDMETGLSDGSAGPTLPGLLKALHIQGGLSQSLIQAAYLDLQINGHDMPQVTM